MTFAYEMHESKTLTCEDSANADIETTPQKRPMPMRFDVTPMKLPPASSVSRSSSSFVNDQDVKPSARPALPAASQELLTEVSAAYDRTSKCVLS